MYRHCVMHFTHTFMVTHLSLSAVEGMCYKDRQMKTKENYSVNNISTCRQWLPRQVDQAQLCLTALVSEYIHLHIS